MRIRFARLTGSALGLGLAVVSVSAGLALSGVGCTVTTSDATLDGDVGTTDSGVVDTYTNDTGLVDAPTDTSKGYAVIVPGQVLVGGLCDGVACDIRDFGGGSTKADIIPAAGEGMLIYDAYATAGGLTSTEIKGTQSAGYVDGKIYGLPAGTPVTITVTGYLRGMMGDGPDKGTKQIGWAEATCTATPSGNADVTAKCQRKATSGMVDCTNGCLTLIPTLKGILFTSDVLPSGYCAGKGASDFDLFRARLPFSGAPVQVSRNEQDCLGMIWVPADASWSEESPGISNWGLSTEIKSSATACSMTNPCTVDRNKKPGACATAGSPDCLDIFVVGSECQMTNASTGGTCF